MSHNPDIERLLQEAWALRREGDYTGARRLLEQAHALCSEDDHLSLGRIYHVYMQFEADHDRYSEAIVLSQKSVAQYRQSGSPDHIAHATRHLADLQSHMGRYAEAEQNYREALRVYREQPTTNLGHLANVLRGFALLLERQQNIDEAMAAWEEASELYTSLDLLEGVNEARDRLSALAGR